MIEQIIKKALIYIRVSTDKQVLEGSGLISQENRCDRWCNLFDYSVFKTFSDEGESGAKKDRPALQEMLNLLKTSKEKFIVVFDDLTRISRDTALFLEIQDVINKYGHQMATPSKGIIDTTTPIGKYINTIEASTGQLHREQNAIKVTNCMIECARRGYYVIKVPMGYKRKKEKDGTYTIRDEPMATIIQEALEKFATAELIIPQDVVRFMNDHPLMLELSEKKEIKRDAVDRMLRNPIYTSICDYKKWKIPTQKWHVEPIISTKTFEMIQDRLNNKSKVSTRKYNKDDENFPLRRWVQCSCCGQVMTASYSRGNGGRFPYYHCKNRDCFMRGKSIRAADLHSDFEKVLREITPQPQMIEFAKALAFKLYKNKTKHFAEALASKHVRLKAIDEKQADLLQAAMRASNEIARVAYENEVAKLEDEKTGLKIELSESKDEVMPFDEALKVILEFIKNPLLIWQKGNLSKKRMVLNLCFSDRLSYQRNEKFRTIEIANIFKAFQLRKSNNSELVIPTRIELVFQP